MGAPATTAFFTGLGLETLSSFMEGMTNARNYDVKRDESLYNAQQERYAATQAYQEGSLNHSMAALEGRRDIASGAAAMSAAGNIGTSAQVAVRESAFNLDKDLAALDYKYANEAIQHKNLAKAYDYNASAYKKMGNQAKISMFLQPLTTFSSGLASGYFKGYLGGAK